MKKIQWLFIVLALSAACKTKAPVEKTKVLTPFVRGSFALENEANFGLDKGFWVEAELVELKENGQAGQTIIRSMIEKPQSSFPFFYQLYYNQAKIKIGKKYGVIGYVYIKGQLLWQNALPVETDLTNASGFTNVTLQRVSR